MKVLIDTNILMDYVLERLPFYENSRKVMHFCVKNHISRCMAAHSILNMHYVLRHHMSDEDRRATLLDLIKSISVVGVDHEKICNALSRPDFKDFEDCVQEECAAAYGADYIITRNEKDFESSRIPAITPADFLAKFGTDKEN